MKKPKKVIAAFLFVVGLILLAGAVLRTMSFILEAIHIHLVDSSGNSVTTSFLLSGPSTLGASFLYGGVLVGFGVLIELVDQILWNVISEEQRAERLNASNRFWHL